MRVILEIICSATTTLQSNGYSPEHVELVRTAGSLAWVRDTLLAATCTTVAIETAQVG